MLVTCVYMYMYVHCTMRDQRHCLRVQYPYTLEASPWYMCMYMYIYVEVHVQATVLADECDDGLGQLVLSPFQVLLHMHA